MSVKSAIVTSLSDSTMSLQLAHARSCDGCERSTQQAGCSQWSLRQQASNVNLPYSALESPAGTGLPPVGALVELRLSDKILLGLALHFYLLPLAFLLVATGIFTAFGAPESVVVVVAALAMVSGFLCLPGAACKQVAWRPVHVSMNTLECATEKPNPKPELNIQTEH